MNESNEEKLKDEIATQRLVIKILADRIKEVTEDLKYQKEERMNLLEQRNELVLELDKMKRGNV